MTQPDGASWNSCKNGWCSLSIAYQGGERHKNQLNFNLCEQTWNSDGVDLFSEQRRSYRRRVVKNNNSWFSAHGRSVALDLWFSTSDSSVLKTVVDRLGKKRLSNGELWVDCAMGDYPPIGMGKFWVTPGWSATKVHQLHASRVYPIRVWSFPPPDI